MPTTGAVCYVRSNGRVLLQLKAEGRFSGGWWNAPGGKVDENESPEDGAIRETKEETNLEVTDLREHGVNMFYFGDSIEPDYELHVFSTIAFAGEPRDSAESRLQWFDDRDVQYDRMWPDDRFWLPDMLAGRRFRGTFRLTGDYPRIVSLEYAVLAEPALAAD